MLPRAFLLCSLVVVAACGGSGGAVSSRAPGPTRAAAVPLDSLAGPWTMSGTERPRSQRVELTAVIESRYDSAVRVDSVATRAWYDWSENPSTNTRRVAGMVRAFAVRSGADSMWRVLEAPTMPVSFFADVPWVGSAPELQSPRADACDPQAAVVFGWRETWVSPPRSLRVGSAWRDSSTTPLCRDGIVLHTVTVRDFEVEGAVTRDGTLRVVVLRRTRAAISGSGLQFGDSVHFEGHSTGEARLELLPEGAVIAAGTGNSELHLTMRGRRRTQELVQRSALDIAIP